MILPEFFAFYPENFCTFSRTLYRKFLYPQLLNSSSINFTKLFFPCSPVSTYLCLKYKKNFFQNLVNGRDDKNGRR